MNPIERIQERLMRAVPELRAKMDPPLKPAGFWFLDLYLGKRWVIVEWRPRRGFGVSLGGKGIFGEGPDAIYEDIDAAVEQARFLLTGKKPSEGSPEVSLTQLRKRRRLSQVELAQRLKVSQASLSELEKDPSRSQLDTLSKLVRALGGELEVRALMPRARAFSLRLRPA